MRHPVFGLYGKAVDHVIHACLHVWMLFQHIGQPGLDIVLYSAEIISYVHDAVNDLRNQHGH